MPEELVARAHELGYAALAITDECSLAGIVRAHVAAKDGGPASSSSAARSASPTARGWCCWRRIAPATATCPRSSRGAPQRDQGALPPSLRRSAMTALPGCLALLLAGSAARIRRRALARRALSRSRAGSPSNCSAGPTMPSASPQLRELATAAGLPLVATGDVHMHLRARRALQDTLTAIRLGMPVATPATRCIPTASAICARACAWRSSIPPTLLDETLRDRRALPVLARRAALRVSGGAGAARRDAVALPARS